ncbi:MAG: tyrosine--tRNA ligase, partial [bacterium]
VDLVAGTSLAKSKSEARQKLTEGAVSVAGRKLGPADRLTTADLLHGTFIPLRRGKRDWHLTRWA